MSGRGEAPASATVGTRRAPSASGSFDVAVVGGGAAGTAAALAAARLGARTVLVERERLLGGNVSQAFVHTICGLFHPSPAREARVAHGGIPAAFAERLRRDGSAGEVEWSGGAAYLPIDPDAFAALAATLCDAEPNLTGRCGSGLRSIEPSPDAWHLELADGASLDAAFVVDATGDAAAAFLAGAQTDASTADELQHASYIFRADGVSAALADPMERARTSTAVARAARSGTIPEGAASVVVRPAVRSGSAFVTMNLRKPGAVAYDPLDPACFAAVQAAAEHDAAALFHFLRRERAPFADATAAWPRRFGIRETRRVRGLAVVEREALLAGARRDDEACVSTWPIELWQSSERLRFEACAAAASIPLGALVSTHPSGRLAMAGRCASATHEALGAIRVLATAMAMGEAAGVACALAAASSSTLPEVDAESVRDAIARGRTAG